jgi:hypothetical protein
VVYSFLSRNICEANEEQSKMGRNVQGERTERPRA